MATSNFEAALRHVLVHEGPDGPFCSSFVQDYLSSMSASDTKKLSKLLVSRGVC